MTEALRMMVELSLLEWARGLRCFAAMLERAADGGRHG